MNAMVKHTAFRLSSANFLRSSPASSCGYELLNRDPETADSGESDDRWRTASKREQWSCVSRDERARHRRAFLRTYKLASPDSVGRRRKRRVIRCGNLRKMAVKAKRLVVSIVSFARATSRGCRSAVIVSLPRPITRCF
ncbi:Epidermal patterning factor-like protein [Psidium guajava]|nr:Epidermal patterning factor-like protein [Psidium guajava]